MRKINSNYKIPISRTIASWIGSAILKSVGWKVSGEPPQMPKCVLIAVPHTSNWDFPIMMSIAFSSRIKIYWMGKRSLFKWPIGRLMHALGGIPIDRSSSHNMVDQAIDAFKTQESLMLAIPPEGTRGKAEYWKSGFYHIALGANVPIVCAFADYKRKLGGFGPTIMPSGDIEADMEKIRAFYAPILGRRPENQGQIRFRPTQDATKSKGAEEDSSAPSKPAE